MIVQIKLIIIIFFLGTCILADIGPDLLANEPLAIEQTFNKDFGKVYISREYVRGSFLIYDCKGQFFACVDQESNSKCQEKRQTAKKELKNMLECAPLKEFKLQKDCINSLYSNIYKLIKKKFCYMK